MNWQDYISIDPKVMLGKPVIKGTRITVQLILERLAYGQTMEELMIAYPPISREVVAACLQYTKDQM